MRKILLNFRGLNVPCFYMSALIFLLYLISIEHGQQLSTSTHTTFRDWLVLFCAFRPTTFLEIAVYDGRKTRKTVQL